MSTHAYWDYTQLRFPRREGTRIDFVLSSPALAQRVTNALLDREERKGGCYALERAIGGCPVAHVRPMGGLVVPPWARIG